MQEPNTNTYIPLISPTFCKPKNVFNHSSNILLHHSVQPHHLQILRHLRRNHHRTTVTDKAATASEWVREITAVYGASPAVVGLDVEWRPHQISYMSNKSATLQLCINNKCLILQLFYMDEIPQSIKDFLLNPNFTYVGIEVEDDVKKLRNEYGLDCGRSMDVRAKAKALWPGRFRRPGLKDLASEVCGLNMRKPKHVCMSNWEARQLSEAQVEYGCIDAFASFKIGHKLLFQNN